MVSKPDSSCFGSCRGETKKRNKNKRKKRFRFWLLTSKFSISSFSFSFFFFSLLPFAPLNVRNPSPNTVTIFSPLLCTQWKCTWNEDLRGHGFIWGIFLAPKRKKRKGKEDFTSSLGSRQQEQEKEDGSEDGGEGGVGCSYFSDCASLPMATFGR